MPTPDYELLAQSLCHQPILFQKNTLGNLDPTNAKGS